MVDGGDLAVAELRRGMVESFVEEVQANGHLTFHETEIVNQVCAPRAVSEALRRLQDAGKVRRISRKSGFFVIVPPEFRAMGAPPIDWWLDDLMSYLGLFYHVGLMTAAAWHGSSHFALMETQVVVPANRKPLQIGRTVIRFFASAAVSVAPVELRTNQWGRVKVGTPATTLVDIAEHRGFGADRLAMVAADLMPKLNASGLIAALDASGLIPTAQRIGYVLDSLGADDLARRVEKWIGGRPVRTVGLDPGAPLKSAVASRWRVDVNADLETSA
jgi:predicted transcriptional regulator of viral defense system